MSDPKHITVSGAPEGFDAQLILAELAKGAPVMHVARDDKRLAAMQAALAFFAPDTPVFVFPAWDCLPYDRVSPNTDISAARMATLAGLVHAMPERFILLTSMSAATQRVPARALVRSSIQGDGWKSHRRRCLARFSCPDGIHAKPNSS